jgi:hypothetical protein
MSKRKDEKQEYNRILPEKYNFAVVAVGPEQWCVFPAKLELNAALSAAVLEVEPNSWVVVQPHEFSLARFFLRLQEDDMVICKLDQPGQAHYYVATPSLYVDAEACFLALQSLMQYAADGILHQDPPPPMLRYKF